MSLLKFILVSCIFLWIPQLSLAECKPIYGEKRHFNSSMLQEIYDRTVSVKLETFSAIDVTDIVQKYIPANTSKEEAATLLVKEGFTLSENNKDVAVFTFRECAYKSPVGKVPTIQAQQVIITLYNLKAYSQFDNYVKSVPKLSY